MGSDYVRAFAYLRLSSDEQRLGESYSITNQRMLIQRFCEKQGIALVREFVDDGYSGGNFNRPGFQEMLRQLDDGRANMVITKDLSRLGRDMNESSYYAETYLRDRGIRYLALNDNFDTEQDNPTAPFLFAVNDFYLRDTSRKVKAVLSVKREKGQYCACPPYGYRKSAQDHDRLEPDPETAPVVRRIFEQAAAGDSSRKIALDLTADGVIPPMKYRALYRDNFTKGLALVSDDWSYNTVKRILKNPVYLGHTLLGKTKKASIKSKKKLAVPRDKWVVTEDTHEPIVTEALFRDANDNLAKGTRNYRQYEQVRSSVFAGIAVCELCGHAMCSCGSVYKGEREKYWYLSCSHSRRDRPDRCSGARIYYPDLLELVRSDLNGLLALDEEQMRAIAEEAVRDMNSEAAEQERKAQLEKAQTRLKTISTVMMKLYTDNAEGRLGDERLTEMVADLDREAASLKLQVKELERALDDGNVREAFEQFFELTREVTRVDELDRETVLRFIERIEIGPKVYAPDVQRDTHRSKPYRQKITIFYRFIGDAAKIRKTA